jgi:DNA modification methylase
VILVGDCREMLATLPERSVQTVITSPPYFGLRDYGHAGQIGLESTPDEFVAALVDVFREVRRVLRDDGCVWLNLGDSYAGSWGNQGRKSERGSQRPINGEMLTPVLDGRFPDAGSNTGAIPPGAAYKAKDLIGIPWMVAFALRADGWYLRSDIIWSKPNPMPESVTDRPTKAHEYLFLLSKGPRYFYDADAIREPHIFGGARQSEGAWGQDEAGRIGPDGAQHLHGHPSGRSKRSVWTVATQPYAGAHFATFPPKLIEPCVLAGSPPKCCGVCGAPWRRVVERGELSERRSNPGQSAHLTPQGYNREGSSRCGIRVGDRDLGWEPTCAHDDDDTGRSRVLDPFAGAGTVGVVCGWHGRDFTGIELNPAYADMARERIALEGRPGGPPNGHQASAVDPGQASIFDLLGGEAA